MLCRYCNQPINSNPDKTRSYWSAIEFDCHAGCKVAGERAETLECQTVDADCNDCKHYQRGKLAPKVVSLLHRKDGTTAEVVHNPNIYIGGTCSKFNRIVTASPNKWSGLECFEHRRG